MIDVTWQPDAETLAEGYRVYRDTPAARRSQRLRLTVVGAFLLVVLGFAWLSHSPIGVFIVVVFIVFIARRAYTGGANDRRWADAFMRDPKSENPQRLEVSPDIVRFHLGDNVTSWTWSEVVEVRESPQTFTFITHGTSRGSGSARSGAVTNSVVIVPRRTLIEDDESRLRALLDQKNKLVGDDVRPA